MKLERVDQVAVVRMAAGRANAINDAWLDRMTGFLDELSARPAGALVITGDGRLFCAGLDLPALLERDGPQMARFIQRFADFMLRLFEAPYPVIAAIDGYAVEGG